VEALINIKTRWLPVVGILLVATMTSLAFAQVRDQGSSDSEDSGIVKDFIPADALKTEAGRQLVERLRFLRRTEASMGTKHPAYKGIQAEIESIKERLGMRPEQMNSSLAPPNVSLDSMGDDELRQLIRRMALRIESLERRLDALERRLEVF
jgi:hypothetical protein